MILGQQNPSQGSLSALDVSGDVSFQYNPEEIQEREVARWANISIQGMHNPRLQYTSGEGRTLTFTLKMYGNDASGKTPGERIRMLRSFVYPDTSAGLPGRPPTRVALSMGSDYRSVIGVIMDVSVSATMFTKNADLIHYAEVTVTMLEIATKAISYSEVR